MKYKALPYFGITLFLMSCSVKKNIDQDHHYEVKLDTLTLFDQSRDRKIPVALYIPKTSKNIPNQQVVIFNHGYGFNKGGDYFVYSYLTQKLAAKGYFTVSIQHELPTDPLLPTEKEQKKYHMIVQPTSINHNHMDDKGNEEEKNILTDYVLKYLGEN
ncbi:hypothetical protein ABXT08_11330 [Chryseobacterium sp. NRRL B-14859]|uniref:hypothetical protein n=1 Tax=Chryseobacterium sp. NRRL B-14859 TaxID=1562763 RepID=UPI003395BB84